MAIKGIHRTQLLHNEMIETNTFLPNEKVSEKSKVTIQYKTNPGATAAFIVLTRLLYPQKDINGNQSSTLEALWLALEMLVHQRTCLP